MTLRDQIGAQPMTITRQELLDSPERRQGMAALRTKTAKHRQRPVAATLVYVLLVTFALVFVVPLLWPVLRSFEPESLATAAPSSQDLTHLTLANYRLLFGGSVGILRYVLNSVIVTTAAAVLTCLLATLAGMGFGRYRFRGHNGVFLLLLSTLMIPFQAILTPLFLEMHDLHLLNSLVGLILVYTTFNLPFGLFVMRNSFRQIPREIEESAVLDGAGTRQMLIRVMGPLVVPGMMTVCIYTFLFSWTEFLAALTFLTSNNAFTLPVELLFLEQNGAFGQVNYAVLEAGAVIAMIPAVVVYLALQRYYVAGLFSGSVKG